MKKLSVDPTLSADQELRFQTDDGSAVTLRFIFNNRSGFWHIDVTMGTQPTLYGIKLVPGWPILKQYKGELAIPGDFLFLPISQDARNYPIAYEDLGKVWFLYWCSDSEIQEWEAYRGLR